LGGSRGFWLRVFYGGCVEVIVNATVSPLDVKAFVDVGYRVCNELYRLTGEWFRWPEDFDVKTIGYSDDYGPCRPG
jgi:hypothetical protein